MIKKLDWILFAMLILIGIAGTIFIYRPASATGTTVIVKENGVCTQRFPLTKDITYTIKNGSDTNILTIKGGAASITEANCMDHYCIRQGSINHPGQSIICLPHKLSIEIQGKGEQIDGISQ